MNKQLLEFKISVHKISSQIILVDVLDSIKNYLRKEKIKEYDFTEKGNFVFLEYFGTKEDYEKFIAFKDKEFNDNINITPTNLTVLSYQLGLNQEEIMEWEYLIDTLKDCKDELDELFYILGNGMLENDNYFYDDFVESMTKYMPYLSEKLYLILDNTLSMINNPKETLTDNRKINDKRLKMKTLQEIKSDAINISKKIINFKDKGSTIFAKEIIYYYLNDLSVESRLLEKEKNITLSESEITRKLLNDDAFDDFFLPNKKNGYLVYIGLMIEFEFKRLKTLKLIENKAKDMPLKLLHYLEDYFIFNNSIFFLEKLLRSHSNKDTIEESINSFKKKLKDIDLDNFNEKEGNKLITAYDEYISSFLVFEADLESVLDY